MRHKIRLEVEGDGRIAELIERFCQELPGREQTVVACEVTQVTVKGGTTHEEAEKG